MKSKQVTGSSWAIYTDDDKPVGFVRCSSIRDNYHTTTLVNGIPKVNAEVFGTFQEAALSLAPATIDTLSTERPIEVSEPDKQILKSDTDTEEGPSRFSLLEVE